MDNGFFAMASRMKFINRWSLMRNTSYESLSVHSSEVAMIAHALCVIGNKRLGKNYDESRAAVFGLYHDASEIITGDMPTPVKYDNANIKKAFSDIEDVASEKLIEMLPDDMKEEYIEQVQLNNKEKRLELLKYTSPEGWVTIIRKCKEDPIFFFNMFLWTYNPRLNKPHVPFITYPYQDQFISEVVNAVET